MLHHLILFVSDGQNKGERQNSFHSSLFLLGNRVRRKESIKSINIWSNMLSEVNDSCFAFNRKNDPSFLPLSVSSISREKFFRSLEERTFEQQERRNTSFLSLHQSFLIPGKKGERFPSKTLLQLFPERTRKRKRKNSREEGKNSREEGKNSREEKKELPLEEKKCPLKERIKKGKYQESSLLTREEK